MSEHGQVASDFSSPQTIEIVGITYRQLDYWTRTGLVVSTAQEAEGSGSRRRYSYNDLLELKLIKRLLDEGIALQRVREVFRLSARRTRRRSGQRRSGNQRQPIASGSDR